MQCLSQPQRQEDDHPRHLVCWLYEEGSIWHYALYDALEEYLVYALFI